MSSVTTPRLRRTSYSSSPKSSPTGPTTRTSQKKLAAREKWTADPPSMRSRSPKGVLTASKAMDPTTTRLMRRGSVSAARRGSAPRVACAAMRAIQIEEFGGPEVMQLADLPVPEPDDGEVLIRVSRAGLNWADTHQRQNDYIARYELPLVPGG